VCLFLDLTLTSLMDNDSVSNIATSSAGKRRIPKACGSCRASKVRCDGANPCARCGNLKKVCIYVERPPDPHQERIESLEREIFTLKEKLDYSIATAGPIGDPSRPVLDHAPSLQQASPATYSASPSTISRKRTRSQFEADNVAVPTFIARDLITPEQAELFFGAFFQGCDRYVPIFDPAHDTLDSISSRSPFLSNAIVTVGCGVLSEADSQICHLLNVQLKKMVNLVIVKPELASLETVQALLVIACYASERSLLLAFATRMALDLGLPDAYEELRRRLVSRVSAHDTGDTQVNFIDHDSVLMRRARVWFQLMVLEQILHVDAGNLRSFQLKGDSRRCRILLDRPFTTPLDLRLLSQVELNALRGKVHDSISGMEQLDEEEVMDILNDVQVDIDVWYNDWKNIMQRNPTSETPVLLVNLEVQKYWSQAIALCRATRALGNETIADMSISQRDLLVMVKAALQRHLRIILDQPQHYLAKFCYAMDFVWAKCAFCFLLLLKLSRLLSNEDVTSKRRLLQDGHKLLRELNKAEGGWTSGGRSATSRIYLQVLHQSIQKYGQALASESQGHSDASQLGTVHDSQSPLNFFWTSGANGSANEIDTFVPEQFVSEWDFPGLEFSATGPVIGDGFFDEFLTGNGLGDGFSFPGILA
jgi:uncharacterized Zn finger protein (UPF0148 family)